MEQVKQWLVYPLRLTVKETPQWVGGNKGQTDRHPTLKKQVLAPIPRAGGGAQSGPLMTDGFQGFSRSWK